MLQDGAYAGLVLLCDHRCIRLHCAFGRQLEFKLCCDGVDAALIAPVRVNAEITRDGENPRRGARHPRIEQIGLAPDIDHGFLRELFRSIRGRAGYVAGRSTLFYGTFGVGYARVENVFTTTNTTNTFTDTGNDNRNAVVRDPAGTLVELVAKRG